MNNAFKSRYHTSNSAKTTNEVTKIIKKTYVGGKLRKQPKYSKKTFLQRLQTPETIDNFLFLSLLTIVLTVLYLI